jgi:hypothetical protein
MSELEWPIQKELVYALSLHHEETELIQEVNVFPGSFKDIVPEPVPAMEVDAPDAPEGGASVQ